MDIFNRGPGGEIPAPVPAQQIAELVVREERGQGCHLHAAGKPVGGDQEAGYGNFGHEGL